MSEITERKSKIRLLYALIQAFMSMAQCAGFSYSTVYMQYKGMSNSALGTVQAVALVLGFAVSSALAGMVDRNGRFRLSHAIWLLLGTEGAVFALLYFFDISGLILGVMYCLMIAAVNSLIPMVIQLCFELARRNIGPDFGVCRAVGSFGFAAVSVIMGALVKRFGEELIQLAGIIYILLACTAFKLLNISARGAPVACADPDEAKNTLSTPEFIRENPKFTVLLVGVTVVFFAMDISSQFYINVVRNVGGDVSSMGGLLSFGALCEMPAMILYGRISGRFKCTGILRFGLIMIAVRILGLALAPSVPWLYAVTSIQGISYALYVPAIVQYTNSHIAPQDATKGQTLAQGACSIGNCLACVIGGIMMDGIAVRTVLMICAVLCFAGAAVCMRGIEASGA